jgi:hypothetical protein
MNLRLRTPPKPKQTNRNTESTYKSRLEFNFGFNITILVELRPLYLMKVLKEGRDDDQGADEDAEEGETSFTEREAVGVD